MNFKKNMVANRFSDQKKVAKITKKIFHNASFNSFFWTNLKIITSTTFGFKSPTFWLILKFLSKTKFLLLYTDNFLVYRKKI